MSGLRAARRRLSEARERARSERVWRDSTLIEKQRLHRLAEAIQATGTAMDEAHGAGMYAKRQRDEESFQAHRDRWFDLERRQRRLWAILQKLELRILSRMVVIQ